MLDLKHTSRSGNLLGVEFYGLSVLGMTNEIRQAKVVQMNDKKARALRKKAGYDVGSDPIEHRRYRTLVCQKVPKVKGHALVKTRQRCGEMKVCNDPRSRYRILKKRYKAGIL